MTRVRQFMLWLMAAAASAAAAATMAQPVPPALQACVHIAQDSERLACFDREMAAASQKAAAQAGGASTAAASAAATPAAPASKAVQAPAGNGAVVGAAAGAAAATAAAASPAAASPAATSAPVAPSVAGTATAASAAGTAATGQGPASLTPQDKLGLSAEGIHKLEVERGITKADAKPADVKPSKELTAHVANVSRNAAGRAVLTLDNGQVWRQSETRSSFEAREGDTVKITPGVMGSFWLSTSDHNRTRVERLP